MELPRDVHRAAKIAAVTEGVQLRDWVAEAIRMRLAAEGAPPTPAKAVRRRSMNAADRKADEEAARGLEILDAVSSEGKPVASIAEPRDFARIDSAEDIEALPNPFA